MCSPAPSSPVPSPPIAALPGSLVAAFPHSTEPPDHAAMPIDKQIRPLALTGRDREDLVAFLESLTGEMPKGTE